jgi:hypothetical protein
MQDLWLLKLDQPAHAADASSESFDTAVGLEVWQAMEGRSTYLYAQVNPSSALFLASDATGWRSLVCLQEISGASAGHIASYHYIVETDVRPESEDDLNAWYAQEHLPGLAAVPGTVRAARYMDTQGSPRYYACYDLVTPDPLDHPAWLAVRASAWSSRVRPAFRNTRRTMFRKPATTIG